MKRTMNDNDFKLTELNGMLDEGACTTKGAHSVQVSTNR